MKIKLFSLFFFSLLITIKAYSQCGVVPLTVNNPSFEGTPQPHVTPPGWDICMPGLTPDTQPGSWTITLPPSNGSSYLGLVHDPSISWQEGAGQTLSSPMTAGMQYRFTIDLATTDVSGYGITPGPVELQLWGGWAGGNGCSQVELLWHSGNVTNLTWVTQHLDFVPSASYDHILFLIQALGGGSPYIMLDNMTPIIPLVDVPLYSYQAVNNNWCEGTTIQFADLSTSPGGYNIVGWNWDFGDGNTSTAQNPSHVYASYGTYTIHLTIMNSLNCTTTVTGSILIQDYPDASFNFANTCANQPMSINNTTMYEGSQVTGSTNIYAHWSFGDGALDDNINPTHVYTSPGQYNVNLFIGRGGCYDTLTQSVTVYPVPNVNLGHDTTLCPGSQISVDAGNPGCSYLWSDNTSGRVATFSSAGNYTVTVTSPNNCSEIGSINVYNYNNPTPAITGLTPVCAFAMETYSTPANTSSVYNWTVTGGNIVSGSGTNNIGIQWGGNPNGTITLLERINGNNCSASANLNVTIYPPLPVLNFPPVPDFCSTDLTYQLNTATPAGGVYIINGTQYQSIDPDVMGAGSYHIVYLYSDAHGCSDSLTHDFNIYDSPVLITIPANTAICYGESVTLSVSGADHFNWSPSTGLSDPQSSDPIANPTTSTVYTIVGSTIHGCYDTTTVSITVHPLPIVNLPVINDMCTYHDDIPLDFGSPPGGTYLLNGTAVTVISPANLTEGQYTLVYNYTDSNTCFNTASSSFNIYHQPFLNTLPGDTNLCRGDGIYITASGADSYLWRPGTGLSDSTSSVVYASPLQTTQYTIIGTTVNGCRDTSSIKIGVYKVPVPDLGSDVVFCNITSYTLHLDNDNRTYDIMWQDGSSGLTYDIIQPGKYWVTIDNSGCKRSDTITVLPCLDIWMPNAFSPNGDGYNETFYGKLSDSIAIAEFNLYIYNRWGSLIYESDDFYKRWDGTFNGKKCPEGVYYWIMTYAVKGVEGKNIKFTKNGSVSVIR